MGEVSIFRGGWEVKKRILAVFIVLAILASLVISVLPVSAAGSVLVDQQEYTETTNFNFTNGHDLAQDFYPQSSYYIDKIAVRLAGITETTGNVNLSLYNVSGSTWIPNVLVSASTPIPVADIQLTASQYYTFQMLTPIFITQGQVYSIVLSVDSGNTITWYFGPYLNSLNYPSYHLTSGSWFPNGANINFDYDIYGTQTAAPTWQTQAASSPASDTTMTLNGLVTSLGSYTNVIGQFSWGLASNAPFTSFTSPTFSVLANHQYSFLATGLAPGTAYIYAFMLTYGGNVGNGGTVTFSTTGTATTTTTPTVTVPTTTTTTTTTTSPFGYTTYNSYETSPGANYYNLNGDAGSDIISQAFTATQDYTLERIGFYGWQSNLNTDVGQLEWHIYQIDSGLPPSDYNTNAGFSGGSVYNNIPSGSSSAVANWFYMSLGTPQTILSGKTYVLTLQMQRAYSNDTHEVDISETWSGYTAPSGYVSTTGTSWAYITGGANTFLFKCQGNLITAGSVGTLPATYKATILNGITQNGYTLMGHVNQLGSGDTSAHLFFQYGPDTSYGTVVTADPQTMTGVNPNVYSTAYDFKYALPNNITYPILHYQAFMVGDTTGIKYYGGDVTVNLSTTAPGSTASLSWKVGGVTSKSADIYVTINSLGTENTFTTVYLDYGKSLNLEYDPYLIINGVDQTGPLPKFTMSNLTPNTTYYLQIKATGGTTQTVYESNPVNSGYSFTTLNTDGSKGDGSGSDGSRSGGGGANIIKWLNNHGISAAYLWILLFFLMGAVWILRLKDVPSVICVILDMVLLGGFIALGLLDIWLVALLALVGAAICFVLIRKTVGAGT